MLVKKLNDHLTNKSKVINKEAELLERELKRVEQEIGNIVTAISSGLAYSSLTEKLGALESEKNELIIKLSQNKATKEVEINITEEQVKAMFAKFEEFVLKRNILECKKFIQDFVDEVIVFKDHVEVIFNVVFSVVNGETVYKKVVYLSKEDMFEKYAI